MLIWLIVAVVVVIILGVLMTMRHPAAMVNARRDAVRAKEAQRVARGDAGPSPLAGVVYEPRERRMFAPIPVPADETIRTLVRRFAAADEDAREELRESLSMDDFNTLLTFACRSAAFGRVDDAIHAIAVIDIERIDDAEVPPVLAYIHHAARTRRVDVRKAFDRAAEMATPAMAKELGRFLEEYPPAADLREEWGFDEVPGGFIQRSDDPYEPTRDLAKLMLELAALLERDRYDVETIEIADTWIGAKDVDVRGGASLYANRGDGQTLMAYLVELADPHQLAETARRDEKGETARLAVARRNLLCLLVQESEQVGGKPIETNQSLERFTAPIESLLEG